MPSWLAARSGAEGTVVATDIDTSWVGGDRAYQVLVSDVAADEALRRMVASLRPGGWLVIEDFDTASGVDACLHVIGPAQERANRIGDVFSALLVDPGVNPAFGRSLPVRVRGLGLVDVRADAYTPVALPAAARLEQANTRQVRAGLVAKGISEEDVDAHLASLAAGKLDFATPALITAWGRKP